MVGAVPPPPYVISTRAPASSLNTLLLPAAIVYGVPSSLICSDIVMIIALPKAPEAVFCGDQPLRAPIRPNLSITALLATRAKPEARSKLLSCVFSPKKPGAVIL